MGSFLFPYDDLLKWRFRQASVPINRIVSDGDVSFIDPQRPTLVFRLYGDLQQPDSLIVTEDDHYALLRNRDKEMLDEVRELLRRNSVLFLGYNLADPDFQPVMASGCWSAWASSSSMPLPLGRTVAARPKVDIWRNRNIMVLGLNQESSVLLSYLASGELPPKQTSPAQVPQREGKVLTPSINVLVSGDFIMGDKAEGDIIGADKTTIETVWIA